MPAVTHTASGSGPFLDSGLEGWKKEQSEGLGDGQDFDGDDPLLGTDGAGRKRKQCKNLLPERKVRKTTVSKNSKSASPRVRSPMQVATSLGVNMLILKRPTLMSRSARRAEMASSPNKRPPTQQSPSCTMTCPLPEQPVTEDALPPPPGWRDWATLPINVLCEILSRIPQADILRGAGVGLTCKSWRRVAVEENLLWRRIDLATAEDKDKDGPAGWQAKARAAVDRSSGRCESFRGRANGEFLIYLADRSPSLRSLHMTSYFYMDEKEFITGVIKKLPLLEHLVLSRAIFEKECLEALLEHCPRLQLVDAGCVAIEAIGIRFVERCKSRIKELRMPRRSRGGGCSCCARYAQRYADKHDK